MTALAQTSTRAHTILMNGFSGYYMGSSSCGCDVTTYIRPCAPVEARVFAARYEGDGGNVVEMSEFGTVGRRWPRRDILGAEGFCLAIAALVGAA